MIIGPMFDADTPFSISRKTRVFLRATTAT